MKIAVARVPVLVINGGDDDGDHEAARLAAMIAGATSTLAGDSNHGFEVESMRFRLATAAGGGGPARQPMTRV